MVSPGVVAVLLAGLVGLVGLLSGCAHTGEAGRSVSNFDPKQIAKSDVDRVADAHRQAVFDSIRVIAEKLYRRNPREWKKGNHVSVEAALDHLLDPRLGWRLPELADYTKRPPTDQILVALREDYAGDRVAAFMAGLGAMLNTAFENKTEFYMYDELDPQKLYNSARNIEIAMWKLANARDASGALLLLSNEISTPPQIPNLSFEREFGKVIARMDLFAMVLAERSQRFITRAVQNLATALFLPF